MIIERPYDPRVCGGGYGITGRGPFVSAEDLLHPTGPVDLAGFTDDARKAIVTNPDYFVWWYTTKSIALCVAVAGLTFMMGRASCKR